ncbi:MAG: HEAT repeat domain-containing protein [Endomicrobiales bacterium]|nr:HEAT repeat domain-containing protein [Endomicrobiales bacterium]
MPTDLIILANFVLKVTIYLIAFLSVFFAVLFVIYISVTVYHNILEKRRKSIMPHFMSILDMYLSGKVDAENVKFTLFNKSFIRDFIVDKAYGADPRVRKKLGVLYKKLGFYARDVREAKSPFWWVKARVLERMTLLEVADFERYAYPMLEAREYEVSISAVTHLVSIKSSKVYRDLYGIFSRSSRWMFRLLVNKLYFLDLPLESIMPLIVSENRDYRKAAAILLGKLGNAGAIGALKKLAEDQVKDVVREAVVSLGKIGLPETVDAIGLRITHSESDVRAACARALGGIPDGRATDFLKALADDGDFRVRLQAFRQLLKKGEAGVEIIRSLSAKYPDMAGEFLKR